MKDLLSASLAASLSYPEYRQLIRDLLAKGKSTGPNQTDALLQFSELNDARMNRLDKRIRLQEQTITQLKKSTEKQTWLVITEGWCGDAAQILPVLYAMSQQNENIDFRLVLRDENEAFMRHFLTNGSKSIPIVIVLDAHNNIVATWGPRPAFPTKMLEDYKARTGGLDAQIKKDLQGWYNKDKGVHIQEDFLKVVSGE